MKKHILFIVLVSIVIFIPLQAYSYIPPTNAYSNIQTQNGTSYAPHYEATVKYEGLRGIKVFASNDSQTIYFNATLGNGTTVTPITCATNYQLHSVDIGGVFTCAANNSTGSGGTTLDTMENLTPAQAYVYKSNSTNINFQFRGFNFTGSLSGSNGSNVITIHGNIYQNNTGSNLGSHGVGVFDSMSGPILQFLKFVSNGSISITTNATNIILSTALKVNSLTCGGSNNFFNSYDNSTGNFVCGTVTGFLTNAILSINGDTSPSQTINSGQGITIVDVGNTHTVKTNFKVNNASCSSGFFVTNFSNSTGTYSCTSVSYSSGVAFKSTSITCSVGSFVSAFDNSTGTYTCTTGGTGTITGSVNAGHANGSVGTLALATSTKIQGRNFTGTTPITVTKTNDTDAAIGCSTCLTTVKEVNIGKGTGSYGFSAGISSSNIIQIKNATAGRNVNIYHNNTDIQFSANNTAYARNIYSTKGITQIEGQEGLYKNNTNTTMINLKTMASINSFNKIQANGTTIMINGSVPTTNVIDIYDQTIGDYSTPSAVTNSSACCGTTTVTTLSVTNGSTTSHTTGWATQIYSQKYVGLPSGDSITKVGVNVQTAAGNVRVKLYADDGTNDTPSTLLGESNSVAVSGTGIQNFTLITPVSIPANGKVWAGFETDSSSLDLKFNGAGTAVQCRVAHTYGTGPSPFGTCIKITTDDFKYYITYTHSTSSFTHPASLSIDSNTATYWESLDEVNPWIYVDTGSAQILSGVAMYWNSSSTSTQILIQTSTDASTWTTKRTTNTNLFTNNAWNYERFNLDGSTERYVRFYGNDGTSKQLSFYELKVLIPSSTTLLLRHGHEFIDSTNATLPINR